MGKKTTDDKAILPFAKGLADAMDDEYLLELKGKPA